MLGIIIQNLKYHIIFYNNKENLNALLGIDTIKKEQVPRQKPALHLKGVMSQKMIFREMMVYNNL